MPAWRIQPREDDEIVRVDPAHEALPDRIARLSRNRAWRRVVGVMLAIGALTAVTALATLPLADGESAGPAVWSFWAKWWIPATLALWSLVVVIASRMRTSLRDKDRERDVRLHQAIERALLSAEEAAARSPLGAIGTGESPSLDAALEAYSLATGRSLGISLERLPAELPGSRPCDACLVVAADGAPTIRLGHRMLAELTPGRLLAVLAYLESRWRHTNSAPEADARTLELTRDPAGLLGAIRFACAADPDGVERSDGAIWFSGVEITPSTGTGSPDRISELMRHLREPA